MHVPVQLGSSKKATVHIFLMLLLKHWKLNV